MTHQPTDSPAPSPTAPGLSSPRLAFLSRLGVLLFWLGVLAGGALAPGYQQGRDYISALASRGSPVAAIGMAAIASKGLAYLAGALLAGRAWPRRGLRPLLALAGLCLLVVAAFRIGCPMGPAGCGLSSATMVDSAPDFKRLEVVIGEYPLANDLQDRVHYWAVFGFQLCLVVAMVRLALGLIRPAPWPRGLAWVSLAAAPLSTYLLTHTGGSANGLWQRGWAATNSLWLLLLLAGALPALWDSERAARTER